MTIDGYQKDVDNWIEQYGVRYFSELTNMALLTEEVGELSRLLAREYGEQSFKNKPEINIKTLISDEMADVIFVVSCLANQIGIDLGEALKVNLQKKTKRDSTRHIENDKLKSE